jgi:hypothetical protein
MRGLCPGHFNHAFIILLVSLLFINFNTQQQKQLQQDFDQQLLLLDPENVQPIKMMQKNAEQLMQPTLQEGHFNTLSSSQDIVEDLNISLNERGKSLQKKSNL